MIRDLYHKEYRLYQNLFQLATGESAARVGVASGDPQATSGDLWRPVMKLVSKERIGGRIKRKYEVPRTPCERLLQSKPVSNHLTR